MHWPGTRLFVLALLLVSVTSPGYATQKKDVQAGRIQYKMVTGLENGLFQVILLNTRDKLSSIHKYCELDGAGQSVNLEVDDRLHQRIARGFSDVEYRICIRLSAPEETILYRVSREDFNQLQCGETVRYQFDSSLPDVIEKVLSE